MKCWLRSIVWLMEGLIVLGVVYFEPTYCVRGVLSREAFFDGRPTSYWRTELERWDLRIEKVRPAGWCGSEPRIRYVVYSREPTWLEQQRRRWFPKNETDFHDFDFLVISLYDPRPSILRSRPEATAVLEELLDDPSPKVRRFAEIGLGIKPEIPDDE